MPTKIQSLTKVGLSALFCAMVATTSLVTPANAGGSFSISIESQNPHDRHALGTALQLFSIASGINGRSGVRQVGSDNNAGLRQHGRYNDGVIYQEGRGHNGSLQQSGGGNQYGIFQFGKNTDVHVDQRGYGGSGATFVFGW